MSNGDPGLLQGTLDLMVAADSGNDGAPARVRPREKDSANLTRNLDLNQGTLYPALLRLEQKNWIRASWGVSDNNRKAKFYELTRAGHKQIELERDKWERTVALMDCFLRTAE